MSIGRIRFIRLALVFGLLSYTIACNGDDSTDPSIEGEYGEAIFHYDGSGFTGTFNASGPFIRDSKGIIHDESFATGIDMIAPLSYFNILGAEFDLPNLSTVTIAISGKEMRDYTIGPLGSCANSIGQGLIGCAAVSFELGLDSNGRPLSSTTSFELISGTLTISSLTAFRMTGTFTGVARQLTNDISGDRYVPDVTVEIFDGTFDVPILSQAQWDGVAQLIPEGYTPLQSLLTR